MPIDRIWIELVINVTAGAVAGGITNHVAVWMLFHPHEKTFGIQGAIPKNKARLAKSLGRTVGERLLSPEDLLGELTRSGVRDAFDAQVELFVRDLLETERPSLSEMLPPATLEALRSSLSEVAASVSTQLEAFVESDDFTERARLFVARTRAELGKRAVGEFLGVTQREKLTERARAWAEEFSRSPELETGVREYLERHAANIISSNEPLVARIPPAALRSIEGAIESYLPLAAGRLGSFLAQPASRERVREALHSLFRRLLKDLEFHQRVIARLVVTERTLDKALDTLERDGMEQLAALLHDEDVRAELTRVLREGIHSFLSKPVSEVLGEKESEKAIALVRAAGDYLLRVLRDERTHGFLATKLREVLANAESRTVGEFIAGVPDDIVVRWIAGGARSERAAEFVREGLQSALVRALTIRIGRPARWLPQDAASRLAAAISPAAWNWIQEQLPRLVRQLDVESMVERKVQSFSIQRMEELIRGVTERELRLIVKLGYLLGAIIGLTTFAVSRLL